ncbi:MAG: 16S rRNA (uracil(1498)-N(3))-methyltransferase [Gammaproteobacteria bacterium]|nr:16S rRNA (uracil(1498)-N(3))-methyltransferase [Gammaproteobacteria bacterium]
MIRLYHSSSLEVGQTIDLERNPSHHLIRVLRAKKGSHVLLFNGDGHEYLAELLDENAKHCLLKIKQASLINNESPLKISLYQGISRSDRMDSCIQKSIELGVQSITPVVCQRTTINLKGARAEKKLRHWQQVTISACEQSGRCIIPEIKSAVNFVQAIASIKSGQKLILNPEANNSITTLAKPEKHISILIGPEGGFSQEEIKQATDCGFTPISLGPRILRTETAGPACIAIAQSLWGDLG